MSKQYVWATTPEDREVKERLVGQVIHEFTELLTWLETAELASLLERIKIDLSAKQGQAAEQRLLGPNGKRHRQNTSRRKMTKEVENG